MRRYVVVAVTLLALLIGSGARIAAQESTPEASPVPSEVSEANGVSFEPIAVGVADSLPPAPAVLQLFRIRIAPGGAFSEPDGDPGTGMITVESGVATMSFTLPSSIIRAGSETPTMQAANEEFTLDTGDAVVPPPGSGGTIRNDGSAELVLLAMGIRPLESASATPTA